MVFPTLPDGLHKLLLLFGVILISLGIYVMEIQIKDYQSIIDKNSQTIDDLNLQEKNTQISLFALKDKSDVICSKYSLPNLINGFIKNDTLKNLGLTVLLAKNTNNSDVIDSLYSMFQEYKRNSNEFIFFKNKITATQKKSSSAESKIFIATVLAIFLFVAGALIIMLISFRLESQQAIQDKILLSQLAGKDVLYVNCQSCGKSFSSIRTHDATGQKINKAFCSDCYINGEFSEPELTFEIQYNRALNDCRYKDYYTKKALNNRLKKLERWRDEYFY